MTQRIAVVTGGLGGLGLAICQALANAGRKVIAADLPASPERLAEFRARTASLDIETAVVDVADFNACAAFGVERFPLPLDLPLKILGDTASGLALLSLGATLEFRSLGPAVRATLPDSAMKLLVHPAAAWLCLLPFSLPRELLAATVLVSAMPHAVNCFIVAQEMDLDAPYAADSVLASTLLSAITFPLWLWVLGLG